jgi:hypothetical protein
MKILILFGFLGLAEAGPPYGVDLAIARLSPYGVDLADARL